MIGSLILSRRCIQERPWNCPCTPRCHGYLPNLFFFFYSLYPGSRIPQHCNARISYYFSSLCIPPTQSWNQATTIMRTQRGRDGRGQLERARNSDVKEQGVTGRSFCIIYRAPRKQKALVFVLSFYFLCVRVCMCACVFVRVRVCTALHLQAQSKVRKSQDTDLLTNLKM